MSKNIVCFGKDVFNNLAENYGRGQYFVFDLDTFNIKMMASLSGGTVFNESKYIEVKKKVQKLPVYTVLAEVYYDKESTSKNDLIGYLIVNDEYGVTIVKPMQLLSLIKKYPFMNFHYSVNNNKEFFKKNPGIELYKTYNAELKEKLGYSFENYNLKREMTGTELSFCMQANEFELGYFSKFYADVFGKQSECVSEIFVNPEGVLIVLNMVKKENDIYDLGYFGSELIAMRHVNSKRYFEFMKKKPYLSCSTCPVDGTKTDITIYVNNNDYYRFFNLVSYFREFSKPCKPFYCSKEQDGFLTILPMISKYQPFLRDEVDSMLEKDGYNKDDIWKIHKYVEYLIGYRILRHSKNCLQEWYANYHILGSINEFLTFISNGVEVKDNSLLQKALRIYIQKIQKFDHI